MKSGQLLSSNLATHAACGTWGDGGALAHSWVALAAGQSIHLYSIGGHDGGRDGAASGGSRNTSISASPNVDLVTAERLPTETTVCCLRSCLLAVAGEQQEQDQGFVVLSRGVSVVGSSPFTYELHFFRVRREKTSLSLPSLKKLATRGVEECEACVPTSRPSLAVSSHGIIFASLYRGVATVVCWPEYTVHHHRLASYPDLFVTGASPQQSRSVAMELTSLERSAAAAEAAIATPYSGREKYVIVDVAFLSGNPIKQRQVEAVAGARSTVERGKKQEERKRLLCALLYRDGSHQGLRDLWPTHLLCLSIDIDEGTLHPGPWREECVHPGTKLSMGPAGLLALSPNGEVTMYHAMGALCTLNLGAACRSENIVAAAHLRYTCERDEGKAKNQVEEAVTFITSDGDFFSTRLSKSRETASLQSPTRFNRKLAYGSRSEIVVPLMVSGGTDSSSDSASFHTLPPFLICTGHGGAGESRILGLARYDRGAKSTNAFEVCWDQSVSLGPTGEMRGFALLGGGGRGPSETDDAGFRFVAHGEKWICLMQDCLQVNEWADGNIGLEGYHGLELFSTPLHHLQFHDRNELGETERPADLIALSDRVSSESHFMILQQDGYGKGGSEVKAQILEDDRGSAGFIRTSPTLHLSSYRGRQEGQPSRRSICIQITPTNVVAVWLEADGTRKRRGLWSADPTFLQDRKTLNIEHGESLPLPGVEGTGAIVVLGTDSRHLVCLLYDEEDEIFILLSILELQCHIAALCCSFLPGRETEVDIAIAYWDDCGGDDGGRRCARETTIDVFRLQVGNKEEATIEKQSFVSIRDSTDSEEGGIVTARSMIFATYFCPKTRRREGVLAVSVSDGSVRLYAPDGKTFAKFISGGGRNWSLARLSKSTIRGEGEGGGGEVEMDVILVSSKDSDAAIIIENEQISSCHQLHDEDRPGRQALAPVSLGVSRGCNICWIHRRSGSNDGWQLRLGTIVVSDDDKSFKSYPRMSKCTLFVGRQQRKSYEEDYKEEEEEVEEGPVVALAVTTDLPLVVIATEFGADVHRLRAFDASWSSLEEVGSASVLCPMGCLTSLVTLSCPHDLLPPGSGSPGVMSNGGIVILTKLSLCDDGGADGAGPDPAAPSSSFYAYELGLKRKEEQKSGDGRREIENHSYGVAFEPIGALTCVKGACYNTCRVGSSCMAAAIDSSIALVGWSRGGEGCCKLGLSILSSVSLRKRRCVTSLASHGPFVAAAEFQGGVQVYAFREENSSSRLEPYYWLDVAWTVSSMSLLYLIHGGNSEEEEEEEEEEERALKLGGIALILTARDLENPGVTHVYKIVDGLRSVEMPLPSPLFAPNLPAAGGEQPRMKAIYRGMMVDLLVLNFYGRRRKKEKETHFL